MADAQLTAGIKLKYGQAGSDGAKPTSWTDIPDITSIPEIGIEIETLETTGVSDTVYRTYIQGLKNTGGALSITANDTPRLRVVVKAVIALQDAGTDIFFAVEIPSPIEERLYFKGILSPLGFGGADVNSVLTTTLNITPRTGIVWESMSEA